MINEEGNTASSLVCIIGKKAIEMMENCKKCESKEKFYKDSPTGMI